MLSKTYSDDDDDYKGFCLLLISQRELRLENKELRIKNGRINLMEIGIRVGIR